MLIIRRFLFYIIFLLISINFTTSAKERSFRTLGPLQGMSQASAISLWQDKWGRMWIGNEVLNCYDGDQVTIYRLSEFFEDIEDADIHGICGNDSVLFFLAEEELMFLDLITNELKRTEIKAYSICNGKDNFYFSNENGLFSYHYQTGLCDSIFSFQNGAIIATIFTDKINELWLGTTQGLFKLNKALNGSFRAKQIIDSESVNCIYKDSRNNIWVSCRSQRAFVISPEEQVELLSYSSGENFNGEIFCFTESTSTGNIWMGTMTGIYVIPIDSQRVNPVPLLPTSMIYALYTDLQGTVWIGSYYGTVRYFNPQTDNYNFWKTDEERYDKIHGVILGCMAEDRSGNLYIATEGSGINIINPQTETTRHLKALSSQLPNDKIRTIWFDEEYNRLFISAYMEGLCYLDVNTGIIHAVRDELLDSRFKRIIEEIIPYRNSLILLTQDGIYKMDRESLILSYLFQDSELKQVCSGFIRTIHIDDRDVLWVSTLRDGLFTIDLKDEKLTGSYQVGSADGKHLPSAIVSICGDSRQGLFLATSKSGLLNYIFEDDSFRIFSVKDNWLLNDICYNLALTNSGNLVVTSNQGVTLINISARKTIDSSWHIRLNDSYPISEIGEDCGLFVSKLTGDIYVGGLYGLFSFNEREMHLPNNNYSLHLSSLFINNIPYERGNIADLKKIILPHNQNTLNLTFATSNYMPAYHTRYQYKLEGLDGFWNDTEHKTITYSSLRPGNYELIIQETTNPEKKIILDIIINSPYWLTWSAFLMYAVVLIIILRAFWIFYKGKAELRASLEMERRENDRMEEINRNQIDFFTSISNEFRTPLTLIISISYSLLQELSGLRKTKIMQIRKQAYFLQNLITEFLDLQKAGWNKLNLNINSYSFPDFVEEMCTSFSIYAQGKLFTYPKLSDETIMVWFDRVQLQKVFYNLFPAAFRLVDEKGRVSVVFQKKPGWLETVIICFTESPDLSVLNVLLETLNSADSIQTDIRSLTGNRIGLILAKRIIDLHKGELFMVTEKDVISIYIRLKLGEKHFSDEELSMQSEPAVPLKILPEEVIENLPDTTDDLPEVAKKYHLLLVDHNHEMLELLTDIFSPVYDLFIKQNGRDGYDYAISALPDLIIAEISLSQMSGIELCKMIKFNVKTFHIPVILISSNPSEKQEIEAVQGGADRYVTKPFNANILFLQCNLLLRSQKRLTKQFNKLTEDDVSFAEITSNQQDQLFLKKAIQVIEDNFENIDFDTTKWSKELGIGRTQLFNRIKNITGVTPNEYILSVKMNHAIMLLQQENQMTVSEIAYSLGFSNPAYFTRCFKKHTGTTPQQFRQDHQHHRK